MAGWRWAWLLVLVSAVSLGDESKSLTLTSANGTYNVHLTQKSPGRCRLEVHRDQDFAWSIDQCIGTVDDLYLVSNQGNRVWVIYTVPRAPRRGRGEPAFEDAVASALYDSHGRRISTRRVRYFYKLPARMSLIKLGAHVKWVQGVAGEAGQRPHTTPQNTVELQTFEPKTFHLKF